MNKIINISLKPSLRHPENSVCRCCCNWNYCNGAEYAGCWGYKKALEYYQEFNATTTTTVGSVATRPKTTPSYKEWTTSDERIVTEIPEGPTPAGPSPMGPTMEGVTDAPPTISIALPELPKCTWTEWGEWDKCTETCGGGQRNRYRTPIGGTIGSPGCEGQISKKFFTIVVFDGENKLKIVRRLKNFDEFYYYTLKFILVLVSYYH